MASSIARYGLRTISATLGRQAARMSVPMCNNLHKLECVINVDAPLAPLPCVEPFPRRYYGKQVGPASAPTDADSDADSAVHCRGPDRSMFWRRKMRTVHHILDVDKDGLISYNDFLLFAERFKALGHLDKRQAEEFTQILKLTWEQQWGAVDPYNLVTVEQYLDDMQRLYLDRTRGETAHRWLPYLFQAVDADKSGYISVKEFQLFYKCLGLSREHAAIAFAVIDTNSDGKLSQKEFVSLGEEFFSTDDARHVSNMFWGPLIQ